MSGHWTGGAANRRWVRTGNHNTYCPGDKERGPRLYAQLEDTVFWCETCLGSHPLHEHRECRAEHTRQLVAEIQGRLREMTTP